MKQLAVHSTWPPTPSQPWCERVARLRRNSCFTVLNYKVLCLNTSQLLNREQMGPWSARRPTGTPILNVKQWSTEKKVICLLQLIIPSTDWNPSCARTHEPVWAFIAGAPGSHPESFCLLRQTAFGVGMGKACRHKAFLCFPKHMWGRLSLQWSLIFSGERKCHVQIKKKDMFGNQEE